MICTKFVSCCHGGNAVSMPCLHTFCIIHVWSIPWVCWCTTCAWLIMPYGRQVIITSATWKLSKVYYSTSVALKGIQFGKLSRYCHILLTRANSNYAGLNSAYLLCVLMYMWSITQCTGCLFSIVPPTVWPSAKWNSGCVAPRQQPWWCTRQS